MRLSRPSHLAGRSSCLLLLGLVSLNCAARTSDVLAAESGGGATKPAVRGENFALKVGEIASLEAESLLIGFSGVTGDSRCPRGVQCVWAGDATVHVWIQPKGKEREERDLHTSGKEPGRNGGSSYEVQLVRLEPHPTAGRAIERGDYVATLQVRPEGAPSVR